MPIVGVSRPVRARVRERMRVKRQPLALLPWKRKRSASNREPRHREIKAVVD